MPKVNWDIPAQAFLESYRKSAADYRPKKKKKKKETEAERLARIEAEEQALLEQNGKPTTEPNNDVKVPKATRDIIKKKKKRRDAEWGWIG